MTKKIFALALALVALASLGFAQQKFITIATGGTAGTYFPLGGALAEIWNNNIKGMNASATSTGASAANIAMLKDNKVDVIFVQNDAAFYAMNDLEAYKGKAMPNIRGLASLYDETCQLVALESSGIRKIADLKGKRVSVGAAGSGVEANARQILEAAGLTYADIKVQYLSFAESASNLKDGNIDAAFNTAGAPTAAIQDLAASKKMILVPVDGAVAQALMKKWAFYTPTKIPANTYQGVTTDVMTVSVKSMLAVSDKLDAGMVYDMLKAMFANGDRLTASHKKGADIKIATGVDGMSIPLHPGAEKFFKEFKK
ncbi:MAG: TAXI family TRAP transporter solute-binding subunit [Spirochaetaceae bacterium]|nr:TAXI family TRAP transporter solute-binding subunit [Spirochaetaceae bacterium]